MTKTKGNGETLQRERRQKRIPSKENLCAKALRKHSTVKEVKRFMIRIFMLRVVGRQLAEMNTET